MYRDGLVMGRRGAVLRAISAIDIALWDAAAKAAELPLYRYLGSYHQDTVPAYASGGITEVPAHRLAGGRAERNRRAPHWLADLHMHLVAATLSGGAHRPDHSFSLSGQIRTPAFFPASQSWRSNVASVTSAPTDSCHVKADASWTAS